MSKTNSTGVYLMNLIQIFILVSISIFLSEHAISLSGFIAILLMIRLVLAEFTRDRRTAARVQIPVLLVGGIVMIVHGGFYLVDPDLPGRYTQEAVVLFLLALVFLSQLFRLFTADGKVLNAETERSFALIFLYLIIEVSLRSAGRSYPDQTGISGIIIGVLTVGFALISLIKYCTNATTTIAALQRTAGCLRGHTQSILLVSIGKDIMIMVVKLLVGILGHSLFMIVNGLYSLSIGYARYTVRKMHRKTYDDQLGIYVRISKIMMVMSGLYMIYTIRLFVSQSRVHFSMSVALLIALYTFSEFCFDVKELLGLRKKDDLINEALRFISFSSTLICFVLTQTAIMSFAYDGDPTYFNALSGMMFGSLVLLTGIMMYRKGKNKLDKTR